MIRKTTWIAIVGFLLLVAAAWYLQQNPLPSQEASAAIPSATSIPALLQDWQDQDITGITLIDQGKRVELTRDADGSWALTPDAAASPGAVEMLRSEIVALRPLALMSGTETSESLGLLAADRTITLHAVDDGETTIQIGAATPPQTGYYARRDGSTPVVLSKTTIDYLFDTLASRASLLPATPEAPVAP